MKEAASWDKQAKPGRRHSVLPLGLQARRTDENCVRECHDGQQAERLHKQAGCKTASPALLRVAANTCTPGGVHVRGRGCRVRGPCRCTARRLCFARCNAGCANRQPQIFHGASVFVRHCLLHQPQPCVCSFLLRRRVAVNPDNSASGNIFLRHNFMQQLV